MVQWWLRMSAPINHVARLKWPDQVQFPEAAPYVGCVCCLILAIVLRGFTVGTPVKPAPQKQACVAERLTPQAPEVRGWSLARCVVFLDN